MAALAVALASVLAACGDDGGQESQPAAENTPTTAAAPAATPTSALNRPLTGSLDAETEYTVGETIGPLRVTFRTGADELILEYLPATFYLSRSDRVTALSVSDLAVQRISEESDPSTASSDKLTPIPADLLAWLSARSFFEVVEPRRPFTSGDATGEVITVRTKPLTTAPNPALCGPVAPTCAVVLGTEGGGPFTTTGGETTDFAVVETGGTKALVIAAHDAAGEQLLRSLRISAS